MNKIIRKSGMNRVCLISFILLYNVFTRESAYSGHWRKENVSVSYNQNDNSISIKFLFYDYKEGVYGNMHSIMRNCVFAYSLDCKNYCNIVGAKTKHQKIKDRMIIKMLDKQPGDRIQILDIYAPENNRIWPDDDKYLDVDVKMTDEHYKEGYNWTSSKQSHMSFKWFVPQSCKRIKSIKIIGSWSFDTKFQFQSINQLYMLDNVMSNSKTKSNAPSELNSEKKRPSGGNLAIFNE